MTSIQLSMQRATRVFISAFKRNTIDTGFIVSFFFFMVFVMLDYYVTMIDSNGDAAFEGNTLARIWWQAMGEYRFVEIPLWIGFVLIVAYIVRIRSRFAALALINAFTLQHALGFMSWLPYGVSDSLDFMRYITYQFPIGLTGIVASIPLTFIQSLIVYRRFSWRSIFWR